MLYYRELYNIDKSLYNIYCYLLFGIYAKVKFSKLLSDHPAKNLDSYYVPMCFDIKQNKKVVIIWKKILFFGYTMDMGGAEKSLLDTVNFLSDKYDISLYLLDKKGILLKDLSNKVKVYEIKKIFFNIYFLDTYHILERKL